MRLQIMSDLHVRYPGARGFPKLAPGVDVVVIAGDVCEGLSNAVRLARIAYPVNEIVLVAGNHEFYGKASYGEELESGRECAFLEGVHLLENNTAIFGDLRIVGATLWTDYALLGEVSHVHAMQVAQDLMRDHKRIKWRKNPWSRFRPIEARMLHLNSRRFIEHQLAQHHEGPTIVVSHHAPIREAIEPTLREKLISAAYASDLREIIDRYRPLYWIWGHTHYSLDERRGQTRMLSNPCGYGSENDAHFDPAFTIEIG
jgi:Icc-related predicted phosphoesterase